MLIHRLKVSPIYQELDHQYDFFSSKHQVLISIVTVAEIYSLAYQRQWQEKKRNQLGNLLFAFQTLPIARRTIIDNYVRIDAYSQGKDPDKPLPIGMTARNMGKNDLWTAATAHEIGASLVTTDKDFIHLQDVFLSIISPYSSPP